MPKLSVVVPVHNEQENILPFHTEAIRHLPEDFELIWVNDGSTDGTLSIIRDLATRDPRVKCISLSRNFGHQAALMAGMTQAQGDITVIMDGDLQHPPALLPEMLRSLEQGNDIVSAKKTATDDAGTLKRSGSGLFYKLFNVLSDTPIEDNVSDFRAFNRKVRDALLSLPERELFLRGLFSWIGFRQAIIPYRAPARQHGRSKYGTIHMTRLALKGAVSFGFKPIRLSLVFGLLVCAASLLYALYALYAHGQGRTVPGWTSTMIVIMFLGGVQLLMIGLIGEYIASLYSEAKRRPLFLVDERINFD